jgi:O-antigen/teichoic acid export membrane protein
VIKNILSSFGAKLVVLVATLGVVMLNTRYLGQEGQGEASLINLGILIIVSFSSIIGGGVLVFLLPRIGAKAVVGPALLWASFCALLGFPLLWLFGFLDSTLLIHVCFLGLFQSLFFFLHQIVLSKEKILTYNFLISVQLISLLISLAVFYILLGLPEIFSFILSLYISFGATVILSLIVCRKWLDDGENKPWNKTFADIFPLGLYSQGGNILHLFNLRFSLIFLEKMSSLFYVGIFSLVLYAAEAIWNIGKSMSIVLGSRLSNTDNHVYRKQLTLSMIKLSFWFTFPLVIIAAFLPDSFYQIIFGRDLEGLHRALLIVSPMILLHACTMIVSHYFSGTGNHRHNMWGSAIGLVLGLISVFILMDDYGLEGASISFSMALLGNFIYHLITFRRLEKVTFQDLKLHKSDFENLR